MELLEKIKKRLKKQTPRWIVFIIDTHFLVLSYIAVFLIVWQDEWRIGLDVSNTLGLVVTANYMLSFYLLKTYRGIIRHTGLRDVTNIFKATLLGTVLSIVTYYFIKGGIANHNLVILIAHFLLTTLVLVFLRILYKYFYLQYVQQHRVVKHILVYGAGTSGIITAKALNEEGRLWNNVFAFVDDNPKLQGNRINGVEVISPKDVNKDFLFEHKIEEIVISIQNISSVELNKIVALLDGFPVKLKIVPPVGDWINGGLKAQQIKEIRIEDLLGRKPIKLAKDSIRKEVEGKVILVTGAAGSIGSEISRQLLNYPCKRLILLDQAESDLYNLQQECHKKIEESKIPTEFVIGDIRDYERVETIFKVLKPDIVFHAAAYKHVPLMENNPYEAINTNIKGTKNVIDAAVRHNIQKFVFVSTDKAVNPTNVMGATKRVAELYVSYVAQRNKNTKFVVTRFGNVLGSNGSVIPLFRKQLAKGGPLTITHPDITRYFMTIPEACQLVLDAGAMAKGGEIYVFDMGESIKIIDLAKRMIQLSGLSYPTDIDIEIVGLRPGEKIFEELLADGETTIPTHHEKIMIANVRKNEIANFNEIIEELITLPREINNSEFNMKLVKIIKQVVPEFISNNSVYGCIDREDTD